MVTRSDCGLRGGLAKLTPCERFRRARGWSQVRLAGLAGVAPGTVVAIEGARVQRLRVETLIQVASTLGVSAVDLVPGLGVRVSAGGQAAAVSGGERRARGAVLRARVKRVLMEKLVAAGGGMRGCDALAQVAGECRVTEAYVRSVRRECGIEVVRLPGRGLDGWEWRLTPSAEPGA